MSFKSIQGIVINHKTYKESDLLITLLTPTDGKIFCLAKGVKNIKSSRLSTLQLGNTIKASLYEKNNFYWLSESKTILPFLYSQKSLTQLNLLFYTLELLNSLIAENQIAPELYKAAQATIVSINKNKLIAFIQSEINLLKLLGFGPPADIITAFDNKQYKLCQKYIKQYIESLVERPLESNKLFT